jgi:hypothetical protein
VVIDCVISDCLQDLSDSLVGSESLFFRKWVNEVVEVEDFGHRVRRDRPTTPKSKVLTWVELLLIWHNCLARWLCVVDVLFQSDKMNGMTIIRVQSLLGSTFLDALPDGIVGFAGICEFGLTVLGWRLSENPRILHGGIEELLLESPALHICIECRHLRARSVPFSSLCMGDRCSLDGRNAVYCVVATSGQDQ